MKILMISPGPPDRTTSGLGIAADRLGSLLAKKAKITVIQPQNFTKKKGSIYDQGIQAGRFDDGTVVKDITRIQVAGNVSPYFYANTTVPEPAERAASEVKNELDLFSKGVIEMGVNLDFDIIYGHDWVTFEAGIQLQRLTKKPLILHVHSLDVDRISSKNHSWIFDLEKRGFEIAHAIIAVSKYTAERIHTFYEIPKRKIKVVYNGCEPVLTTGRHKKVFNGPVILFAGRLSSQKAPQTFIEVAKKILSKRKDARFIMAGDGPMRTSLIDMAAHKGIGDRIHFTGYLERDELAKVFAESTIFFMPSVSEPFGLSAIEAALAELPVIISKQSGASEILPNALVSDFKDISGFVKHIMHIIDEKVDRNAIVMANKEAVEQFTWDKATDDLYKIFEEIMD